MYSDVLCLLQFLLFEAMWIIAIDFCHIDEAWLVALPRVTKGFYSGQLDHFVSHVTCLLTELTESVAFIVCIFGQTCRKLQTKFANWRPKVSNQHELLTMVLWTDNRDNLHSINKQLLGSWCCPISWFVGRENSVSNWIYNFFNSKPFAFIHHNLL